MTDLITRLQAAEGPSRELDAEIALMRGWTAFSDYWLSPSGRQRQFHPPSFTSSIDAALTLVPEGFGCTLHIPPRFDGAKNQHCVLERWDDGDEISATNCATPALALCIAALRARGAV